MQINLNDTYVAKNVMSGIGKRSNKKWQAVTIEGNEKINIFVDNDIDLNNGDIFTITKINAVNYSISKKGDKFYHNYSANCEVQRSIYDNGLDDIDITADMDKVLK